ncbi:MAG: penicillin acylase family protein [Candidatus Solibacter usitatus]|nr:penicillin acylase family protein [Candidatus Solibacter usitatus]
MRTLLFLLAMNAAVAADRAEKVEVLRDEFGVPHIFAKTQEGAVFASGYVQAEDRLEELHVNMRKALGTMAEAFGEGAAGENWVRHDGRQRMWEHARVAQEKYSALPAHVRRLIEAFTAGIAQYKKENPGKLKQTDFRIEPWHIVAYGRFTIWRWHEGDAGDDLRRAGIQPDPIPYRGSNQMLIAPSRTAMKAPIAIIDPHLSWYGETRYYEMRIYGGQNLAWSGGARVGLPFPTLGHGRYVSIAMTTGGPDTGDSFEETVRDGKYLFRGEWKPLRVRKERIGVKRGDRVEWTDQTIEYTHHGPLWAHKDGKAYSMATPYATEYRLVEQAWNMITSRNLFEMKRALDMKQYMSQNIMVGTVDGDIFYLRNGRVPIRAQGCDPTKPQDGTGPCEWPGIHEMADLVQIHNPPQGYMQNNNTPPYFMMRESPMTADKWAARPYLYNGTQAAHQRAAMTLEQLDKARGVTAEQAIDLAFSPQVFHAELWQDRIRKVDPGAKLLIEWNRRSDADSRGALAFYLFKMALGEHSRAVEPPEALTDSQVRAALKKSEEQLRAEFPADATFGTYFRVGRRGSERTFPVSGGTLSQAGMATPRAVTFEKRGNLMVGTGGQTQTQIVVLSKPPKSWMILPLGESDDPKSPHFDDQAEKLFSKSRAKDTYFLNRKELEKHVTARRTLEFVAR